MELQLRNKTVEIPSKYVYESVKLIHYKKKKEESNGWIQNHEKQNKKSNGYSRIKQKKKPSWHMNLKLFFSFFLEKILLCFYYDGFFCFSSFLLKIN